jgi:predicted transcriptional regulator
MLAALESRVNALMTDFVNRDDPAQKAAIADDRGKAIGQMNRVKQDIEKITKEIADIEEEARKAGVPAGWLR